MNPAIVATPAIASTSPTPAIAPPRLDPGFQRRIECRIRPQSRGRAARRACARGGGMGTQDVGHELEGSQLRLFTRKLLQDLRALERMLDEGMFESGVRRIGAEQEMFIVGANWRPSMAAMELLEAIDDEHYTTELGRFNLECNLDPQTFGGDCLSKMEAQLESLVAMGRKAAAEIGDEIVLVGSLPTMRKSDLGLSSMSPIRRYELLDRALQAQRNGNYDFLIKGVDELRVTHDNIMLEACNCSFQVHFQVAPNEFANLYNIAQVVAAPVLAMATNSPLLFARRLWRETRIALFQQSIDTRSSYDFLRERSPRVTFGEGWVEHSVLELYREDAMRFRALLGLLHDEDPFEELEAGRVPKLRALSLHNSTVYRWNRACYGQTNGVPHLRIENRVLPSGPTIVDEMANGALWFGLITALSHREEDIRDRIDFDDAKANFFLAAQHGMNAQFTWFDGVTVPADQLVSERLLPLAEEGLRQGGVDAADIERYLGVIEARAMTRRTGSRWQLESLASMGGRGTIGERMNALVAGMIARQKEGRPVSDWDVAGIDEGGGWKHNFLRVEQYMTNDLFTVNEDESIDLVANLMIWKRIHHVPVEDNDHKLVGMVSYRHIVRLVAAGTLGNAEDGTPLPVRDVMKKRLITCEPETLTLEAIRLMRDHGIGALPVVKDGQLVGIITQHDFMIVARELLESQLGGAGGGGERVGGNEDIEGGEIQDSDGTETKS